MKFITKWSRKRTKYITELVKKLKARNDVMKPCTEVQIERLKSIAQGRTLPQAYLEFMSAMGNGAEFMRGESVFMDEIDILQEGAIELLEENESQQALTDDDFVFWMSQGCTFCFFRLNEGDNPPVYYYDECGKDAFIKIANSLTEFFMNYLEYNHTFEEKP